MKAKDLNEVISEYCSGRKSLQELPELFNPLENMELNPLPEIYDPLENMDLNLTFGFCTLLEDTAN